MPLSTTCSPPSLFSQRTASSVVSSTEPGLISKTLTAYAASPHTFHLQPPPTVLKIAMRLHGTQMEYKQADRVWGAIEITKPMTKAHAPTPITQVELLFEGHITTRDSHWMFMQLANNTSAPLLPMKLAASHPLSVPFEFYVPETVQTFSGDSLALLHRRLPPLVGDTGAAGYSFYRPSLMETKYLFSETLQTTGACVVYFVKAVIYGANGELLLVLRRQIKVIPEYSAPSPVETCLSLVDRKEYYQAQGTFPDPHMVNRLLVMQTVLVSERAVMLHLSLPLPLLTATAVDAQVIQMGIPHGVVLPLEAVSVNLLQRIAFGFETPAHHFMDTSLMVASFPVEAVAVGVYDTVPGYTRAPSPTTTHTRTSLTLLSLTFQPRRVKLTPTFHTPYLSVTYFYQVVFATRPDSRFKWRQAPQAVRACVPVVLKAPWAKAPAYAFTDEQLLYGYALNEALPVYQKQV